MPKPDALFLRGDVELISCGHDRTLLVHRRKNLRRLVPHFVGRGVESALRFRTIREHALEAARRAGVEHDQVLFLEQALTVLARDGFLVAADGLGASAEAEASCAIRSICVPSGDRSGVLLNTLGGYADNLTAYGRRNDFVVLDTSKTPDERQRYRDGLAAVSPRVPGWIWYADADDVERYVGELAREGIDPEVARFGLLDPERTGRAYGTARNALLLQQVGDAFLSVDDDVECSIAPAPDALSGIELFTGQGPGYQNYDPHEYWYFRDRAAVLAAAPGQPKDAVEEHERFLGHSARAIAARYPADDRHLDNLLDPRLAETIADGSSRVLVTFFGLRGDAGMYAPTWHLLKTGASRDRLVENEVSYRTACTSRELMRAVRRPVLSDGRWYQTTLMGLDNRQILPPTSPIMRYEDGVFRILLHRMYDTALCAYLPWTVLHNRPPGYPWTPELLWKTGGWTRTGEMIVRCVLSASLHAYRDPLARLRSIGSHLTELGSMPRSDFFAFLSHETMRQKGMYVEFLESLLTMYGAHPTFWANDLRKHIDAFRDAAESRSFLVPWDLLQEGKSLEEAEAFAQRIVLRFGRLLYVWADIVDAARALRGRGIRLAHTV